jgi:hypothetical protein
MVSAFARFTSKGDEEAMQTLVELLKYIAALAVIVGVGYYWWTSGLPPKGKGRWRKALKELSEREKHHNTHLR